MSDVPAPRLYTDLAKWFHLLTAPADYEEEAAFYTRVLNEATSEPPRTVLELGSGGGNNASHMKAHFELTLVDLSPEMLALGRTLNPELEHLVGDMRDVRLGREFDAVFVHDAVAYVTTRQDLHATMETAFVHCRPGGVALFVPDQIRDTFRPGTSHGGHDGDDGRALRYVHWIWDPDPTDTEYVADFAYLLREGESVSVVQDRHVNGLFGRDEWLELLADVGFEASARPAQYELDDLDEGREVFVGLRPS
jgi:SAM-dependent methyltransferase